MRKFQAVSDPEGVEESIVAFLCYRSQYLSDTRLTKLLYLVDLYYSEIYGQPLTKIRHKRYFYGPWSDEISAIKEQLIAKGVIREDKKMTGLGIVAKVPKPILNKVKVCLNQEAVEVVEAVLEDWGSKSTDEIVEYVKTRPPYIMASFNEPIDFTKDDPIKALASKTSQTSGEIATEIISRSPRLKELALKAIQEEMEGRFAESDRAASFGLPI